MAVLLTPPYLQFFDANGDPLAGGKVYTYAAQGGTFATPKATYTTEAGNVENDNPVILDSAGRPTTGNGSIWLSGTYDFKVTTSADVLVKSTLNVTAFQAATSENPAYFQSFSGDGTTTAFTTSSDLGTEEKAIFVWVNSGLQESVGNGTFASDTIWTKGAGWTIAAGVATATGAISTAISQDSLVTLIAGQAYAVNYTITRSAGDLIPSVGGNSGATRSASGTYREVIVAGATQVLAFTGAGFTGTLDTVSITVADSAGYDFQNPSAYTISGTTLTFATAPASGTNNIYVSAPSLLIGAASAAAANAEIAETNALASEVAAAASETAAAASEVAAELAETNAETAETNAETAAALAQDWATKINGQVAATDYSAKAWAIGGTGTETNNAKYYSEQAAAIALGDVIPMTEQGSPPATPSASVSKLYFNSSSALSSIDDTGLVRTISKIQIYSGFHPTPFADELPFDGSSVAKTSGGTYNGAQYERVYTYVWTYLADAQAAVAGGRGLSAAADFAANKTITLPDFRDYTLIGVSGAGSITTVGAKAGATTVTSTGSVTGTAGTTGATTLSTAQIPSHDHQQTTTTVASGALLGGVGANGRTTPLSDAVCTTVAAGGGGSHTHTGGTLSATFTGDATSVLQKSAGVYWYITF